MRNDLQTIFVFVIGGHGCVQQHHDDQQRTQ